MASFTDIVPQFNPYVQQLPVELMLKVGMEKQKRYEENVTKIQSQIDQIAGLEMVKDGHKQYLSSKMNQLGSRLTKLASADFSNFQVVNSVAGMTGEIIKDPIIQTGVKSTAHHKAEQQKIEKAKADGTWGAENEWLYGKMFSEWYNNPDLKTSFSANYVPYRDVYKKVKDIAKEVGIDETLVQNMFDANGKPNMYMIETMVKGKDANKIYTALMGGLDQTDFQQLGISGMYKYRGYNGKDLIPVLQKSSDDFTSLSNDRKIQLLDKIKEFEQKRLSVNATTRKQIDDEITKLNAQVATIDTQLEENQSTINEYVEKLNLGDESFGEQLKSNLYTKQFLNQMSTAFASKESHVKFSESPLWKALFDERKFVFDQWKERQNLEIASKKLDIDREANRLKRVELGLEIPAIPSEMPGGEVDVETDVKTTLKSAEDGRRSLYIEIARDALKDKDVSIFTMARAKNQSVDDFLADYGAWYSMANRRILGNKIPPSQKGLYNKLSELNETIAAIKPVVEKIEQDFVPKVDYTKIQPVTLTGRVDGKAKSYTLSGEQAALMSSYIQAAANPLNRDKPEVVKMKSDLMKSIGIGTEDEFKRIAKTAAFKDWTTTLLNSMYANKQSRFAIARGIGNIFGFEGFENPFGQGRQLVTGDEFKNYKDMKKQAYSDAFPGYRPKSIIVPVTDKNKNVINAKVTQLANVKGETANIKPLIDAPNSTLEVITLPPVVGAAETRYGFRVTSTTGSGSKKESAKSEIVPITQSEYEYLTGKPALSVNPIFSGLTARINMSGTTNRYPEKPVYETALFDRSYLQGIRGYNVSADIVGDKTSNGNYFIKLYFPDAGPIEIDRPFTSLQEAYNAIPLLNDSDIKAKLKQN